MTQSRRVAALVMMFSALLALTLAALHGDLVAGKRPGPIPTPTPASGALPADRNQPPVIQGVPLSPPSSAAPPAPAADLGSREVPFAQWWSSVLSGTGSPGLWAIPLLARIDETGRTELSVPARSTRSDGFRDSRVIPAMFATVGGGSAPRVVDFGDLHVRLAYSGGVSLTLSQGSPVAEWAGPGTLSLMIPALGALESGTDLSAGRQVSTSVGPWVLATSGSVTMTREGDTVRLQLGADGHVAAAPTPDGAPPGYVSAVASVAAHPITATAQQLQVASDGTTKQTLTVTRDAGTASLWGLMPRHQDHLDTSVGAGAGPVMGALNAVDSAMPIRSGTQVTMRFDAVPVLWSAVPAPGAQGDPAGLRGFPVGVPAGEGSYFAGKAAAVAALLADRWQATGDTAQAQVMLHRARADLERLVDPTRSPYLTWDTSWGAVVIEPAEFGVGEQLNDHQLQYGYWVAAAAIVAEQDRAAVSGFRDAIDLLIADYTVTWSPYHGHSWASGTSPFADGNNLESISESTAAWWAAARWYLATDRPKAAEPYLARLAVETSATGYHWLPKTGDAASGVRPWTGVVWAGKDDPNTWFDPAPESALGIRLLPLGPMSLSRYDDAAAIAAAQTRWRWCAANGGCDTRWANLLDSDAAVAGVKQQLGPDPEESTTAAMIAWWRQLWTQSSAMPELTCSPGVVARRDSEGTFLLASNPARDGVEASCHRGKELIWRGTVKSGASVIRL